MKPWLRALRWVAVGVAVLVLALALAWLAGPSLIKAQIEQRGSAALGRALRVGEVSVQPLRLEVTLRKLQLAGAAGSNPKDPQASIERLRMDLNWHSLFRLAPVVEAVEVDAPKLRIARVAEGRYDIDDIVQRLRPDPKEAPSPTPKFALYNVKLRGGEFRFDDRPVARQQRVTKLNVTLPFLSNLPADLEANVEPRVAFLLNGTPFDSGAVATPFAQARQADLTLKFDGYQLEALQAYLPKDLHLRPQRGKLDAQLALRFTQDDDGSRVTLRGELAARDVRINDAAGQQVATWQVLRLGLNEVRPLERRVALGTLRLDGLVADVRRSADGRLNLQPPVAAGAASAPQAEAPAEGKDGRWSVQVDKVELSGAQLQWRDDTVQPAAALQARGVDLRLGALAWPLAAPVDVKLAADLVQGEKFQPAGRVVAEGSLAPDTAAIALELTDLVLDHANPYLGAVLATRLEGRLSATGQLQWSQGETPRSKLKLGSLKLADLRLLESNVKGAPAGLRSLDLTDTDIDLLAHTVIVAKANLSQPSLSLLRDSDGRWNASQWLRADPAAAGSAKKAGSPAAAASLATKPPSGPAAAKATSGVAVAKAASAPRPASSASAASSSSDSPVWQVDVRDFKMDGGRLRLFDAIHGDPPVTLDVDNIKLGVQSLRWPTDAKTPLAAVQFSARVLPLRSGSEDRPGQLDWRGKVLASPLRAEGTLVAERLPLHALEPYFSGPATLDLVRAELGWKGDFSVKQDATGWTVAARGDALLADLNLAARKAGGGGDELLAWQSLALQGVQLALAPGGRPQVDINEATLSDFYARLVVTEQGRLNLQEVGGAPVPVAAGASAASATAPAASASAAPADTSELPLVLSVGRTKLVNGKVDFADRFIRPNYSAALTELNGSLGKFQSNNRDMATLELRGRAAGTAALEIAGSINPTARPLALDIRAKASDLELAPLSPYAGKYAGYAIERGKLTMEVDYKIAPDGKLDAKNKVVLNQLTFGDKVDSAEATKLPVLLAVALLKDRNGVIDINLPVSGSINDPQFSVGGVVLKVIVNLLTKALTAPFALLSGGGSEDLSLADFEPGTARLSPKGRAVVDKVAQALLDRPALRMTVTGAADPVSERAAMQAEALAQSLRNEHRRDKLRGGAASDATLPPPTTEERARLLRVLFNEAPGRAKVPAGTKEPPLAEMEAALRAAMPVNTDTARDLALQRGLAVRDALVAKGLPSERLFLAAPRLRATGEDDAAWTPRVQLSLSAQ
ncbi:uncharacterized protein involved in outer membrane biogenesis [Burkholderiales bacterium JOSHI_001]|nr:uncharacterized protein involved in outer membrane biogenesis [Burkholderiales bacterium JOSHI_001]